MHPVHVGFIRRVMTIIWETSNGTLFFHQRVSRAPLLLAPCPLALEWLLLVCHLPQGYSSSKTLCWTSHELEAQEEDGADTAPNFGGGVWAALPKTKWVRRGTGARAACNRPAS